METRPMQEKNAHRWVRVLRLKTGSNRCADIRIGASCHGTRVGTSTLGFARIGTCAADSVRHSFRNVPV